MRNKGKTLKKTEESGGNDRYFKDPGPSGAAGGLTIRREWGILFMVGGVPPYCPVERYRSGCNELDSKSHLFDAAPLKIEYAAVSKWS